MMKTVEERLSDLEVIVGDLQRQISLSNNITINTSSIKTNEDAKDLAKEIVNAIKLKGGRF